MILKFIAALFLNNIFFVWIHSHVRFFFREYINVSNMDLSI